LFILYILTCIADGPDVKPILKVKIGSYLHNQADKFYHAHYCKPDDCIFVYKSIQAAKQKAMADIEITNYDTELIKHTVKLDEEQIYMLKNNLSSINLIDQAKRICSCAILHTIERRIKFDINEYNPDYCVYVTGSIVVEKNDRRHKEFKV
jgi:hypothetical protein